MVYIIIVRGPDIGKEFDLSQDEIRVGRGGRNDIVIHDNEVSREHLIIRRTPQGFELTDLGSDNGTYINGRPVDRPALLRPNSLIELGVSITLEFRLSRTGLLFHQHQFSLDLIINNDAPKQSFPLEKDEVIVGRSVSADIQLVRAEMSREHFKIISTEQGFFVEDMGSTNGTWVNDQLIDKPTLITTHDVIHIGNTIAFQLSDRPMQGTELVTDALDAAKLSLYSEDRTYSSRISNSTMMAAAVAPSEIGTGITDDPIFNHALITYSRPLWSPIVTPIINQMIDEQIDNWVDQYLTQGSPDWHLATERARSECWLLIVIVSPDTLHDESTRKHIRHFSNRDKPIIAFVYETVGKLPQSLADAIRIDYNPAMPSESIQQLMRQIKYLKSRSDDWNL